jgi:hypothetical protein
MPTVTDFPAAGRISAAGPDNVTFLPQGTNYELQLAVPGGYSGPLNQRVSALIRARGRKVFTTEAGGNFVAPIFGRPTVIQGRILHVEGNQIVVRAGLPIVVDLPDGDNTIDLENGELQVGTIVNVVAQPGATLELLMPAKV